MAQRSADQITLTDLTDGVNVILSSEAYAFPGTATNVVPGNTSTKVQALMGASYVDCTVNLANVTKPAGVTVTSTGGVSPTLTIAVAGTVTSGGEVIIPVTVGDLTIEKRFSYSIAFQGVQGPVGETGSTGGKGDKGDPGAPAINVGLKNEAHAIVTNSAGATTAASTIQVDFFAYEGANRVAAIAAVTGLPTGMSVGTNTAATTSADGVLTLNVINAATLGGADSGVVTVTITAKGVAFVVYFSWSKAKQGTTGGVGGTGAPGADAVSLEVTSSNGSVFKNTGVATTLTAKVYKGAVEVSVGAGGVVTGTGVAGTVKWYKNGVYLTGKDSATLAVTAADVPDRAVYEAKLEY